jgi:hypothetical protein
MKPVTRRGNCQHHNVEGYRKAMSKVIKDRSLKFVAQASFIFIAALFCMPAAAQQSNLPITLASYKIQASEPVVTSDSFLPEAPSQHVFWDGKNRFLFSTVAMFSGADFAVTHMNLVNGGRELNPLVRPFTGSTPALAANFAGQTAGVIAVSYLLHKSGHHKLERMVPVANIASSAFAVAYGLSHR